MEKKIELPKWENVLQKTFECLGKYKSICTWVMAWLQKCSSLHMAVLYVGIYVIWSCQCCVEGHVCVLSLSVWTLPSV